MSLSSDAEVIGFYLDKQAADLAAFVNNRKVREAKDYYNVYIYMVSEVTAGEDTYTEKEYKAFIEEQRKEIQEKIDKKRACRESDEHAIAILEKELSELIVKK